MVLTDALPNGAMWAINGAPALPHGVDQRRRGRPWSARYRRGISSEYLATAYRLRPPQGRAGRQTSTAMAEAIITGKGCDASDRKLRASMAHKISGVLHKQSVNGIVVAEKRHARE